MFFSTHLIASTLLAAASFAGAAPHVARSNFNVLDVYAPPVTAPKQGDQWPVGSTQKVEWDTTDMPDSAKNYTGTLLLGYQEGDSGSEHLDIAHPLAIGFMMASGCTNVTVPAVDPRDDYIVVLIGDSGDASKKFSIVAA